MLEENKAIARRLFEECWNRGTTDVINQIVAAECRIHDPAFPSLGPGPENMGRHIQMCRTAFPDLRFTVDDVIAERDEVVVHWSAQGTHRGQFLGVAPTGKRASVSGTSILRIRSSKLIEQWVDWNLMTLLEQLGVPAAARVTSRS